MSLQSSGRWKSRISVCEACRDRRDRSGNLTYTTRVVCSYVFHQGWGIFRNEFQVPVQYYFNLPHAVQLFDLGCIHSVETSTFLVRLLSLNEQWIPEILVDISIDLRDFIYKIRFCCRQSWDRIFCNKNLGVVSTTGTDNPLPEIGFYVTTHCE